MIPSFDLNKDESFHWPQPDLTKYTKNLMPGKSSKTFMYPVSIRYNGGTVLDNKGHLSFDGTGKWYSGYTVPKPIIPKGYRLTDMGIGLELNCHPPHATSRLVPVNQPLLNDYKENQE